MPSIDEVFAEWNRAIAKVADLARVPVDRRREFWEELSSFNDSATEWDRLELLAAWNALSTGEQRAIENARRKQVAAYNAFRALTPAARALVAANGPGDQVEMAKLLTAALSNASGKPPRGRTAHGRGRPAGRTLQGTIARELIGMIESCGGKLPSVDHDPDSSTINKIIKILQPHFPKGDLRPVSASTFRRAKREIKPGLR